MRCITKISGRKIYRPLKPRFPKWWKLNRVARRRKRHKRDRVRFLFRGFARTRNSSETLTLRRRKLYLRRKKLFDYVSLKSNVSASRLLNLATVNNSAASQLGQFVNHVPGMGVRAMQALRVSVSRPKIVRNVTRQTR